MTLRFTDPAHLAGLPAAIRAQIEREMPDNPDAERIARAAVPGGKTRRSRPEQEAGRALVKWADATPLRRPGHVSVYRIGDFLAHTPNGGARGGIEAAIFAGQGVRKGWPDYTLHVPVGRFHGLVGELKAPDGAKPDADQLDILSRLEAMGYKACVWWGFDDAREQIENYLAGRG